MNHIWQNVRAHFAEPVCSRTAVSRIRDAVLHLDPIRYNLWGI